MDCSGGEDKYSLKDLFANGFSHTLILKLSGFTQKCDVDTDMQDEAAVKNCEVKLDKGQIFKPTIYIPEEINEDTTILLEISTFQIKSLPSEVTNIANSERI